jgi:hypothetical protein
MKKSIHCPNPECYDDNCHGEACINEHQPEANKAYWENLADDYAMFTSEPSDEE